MTDCPSLDDLRRLASESLHTADFAALDDHLERCDPCRRTLEWWYIERPRSASSIALPPPVQVPGYRIERELGRGGMGVVYLATRLDDGRPVALKLLGGGPDDLARWRREAEAMRRIDHPGVVRLIDSGEVAGRAFLAMEYVAGGSLHDRLDPARPPKPEEAARVVEGVARAIAEVHRCGLLHLDLKPSNVLLDGDPDGPIDRSRPRVADFGLALPCDDPEATWTMAAGPRGTPSYMAPEQLAPERSTLGPAADVYALGALLYRMLTGRPPFLAPTKIETYLQLRDRDPVPPRRLNPGVPRDLETICLACLRKRPARRYGSAEALADDLGRFLDGRPIAERPTPRPVVAARWCLRNRAVAGLGLASAVLAVALFGIQSARLRAARIEDARQEREVARLAENLRLSAEVLHVYQDYSNVMLFRERPIDPRRLVEQLAPVQERFRRSWKSGTIDAANLAALGQIDLMAATVAQFGGLNITAQIAPLIEEAEAALSEAVTLAPDVESIQRCYAEAKLTAIIYQASLDHARSESLAEEALAFARSPSLAAIARPTLMHLHILLNWIAWRGYCRGDHETNERWLSEASDLMTERLGDSWHQDPYFVLSQAASLLGLGDEAEARELLAAYSSDFGAIDHELIGRWQSTRWFTYRIGALLGLSAREAGPGLGWDVPPAELVEIILDECATMGISPGKAAGSLAPTCLLFCTAVRQGGTIDDAERVAACFLAVAREFVGRDPDSAGSHELLGFAYQQHAKNAWRRDDLADVRRWLRASIEAAETAVALDPEDSRLQIELADRRRRLAIVPEGDSAVASAPTDRLDPPSTFAKQ